MSVLEGVRDVALFIISHEQTQYKRVCNFISLFWFGCSRWIDFYQNCYRTRFGTYAWTAQLRDCNLMTNVCINISVISVMFVY